MIEKNRLDHKEQATVMGFLKSKNVLTFVEAATYMGVSKSHLYKLTMARAIPHYKPRGKMVYFDLVELEEWLKQSRVATNEEMEVSATSYLTLNQKSGRS